MVNRASRTFFVLSPILILIITQLTAVILGRVFGAHVYIPIILVYWAVLAFMLWRYGCENVRTWLQKPRGHWIWIVVAVVVAFSSLPLFLQHFRVLGQLEILIPTVIFVLINPWLEEFYWRGMLLDVTAEWPWWVSILYSTVLFTAFHATFAWYSAGARNLPFYLAVFVLGLVMALIYRYTKSVWLTVIAHMIINALNLTIPTLLNVIEF